jgi:RNA polymerase sigma-70 factor (ECF subfamily)
LPAAEIHNEAKLLQQAAEGDQQAFQQLFNAWWDPIYANALRFLKTPEAAEELTQEIFIHVWMKKEKLASVGKFGPWLFRVAKNLFLDHLRKELITGSLHDLEQLQEDEPTALRRIELRELQSLINTAIASLPDQMRMAFTLSRFHGLTHEQIAGQMNITKATSQNYIARSLIIIRKQLVHYLGLFL